MRTPKIRKFDLERFSQMVEPFKVRVERIRGNGKTPIALPPSPSTGQVGPCQSPADGWSAADVAGLEQWLATQWSGGGFYVISIVDANNVSMEWEASFDPATYPEKTPPPLQAGGNGVSSASYSPPAAPVMEAGALPIQEPWPGFLPMYAYQTPIPPLQGAPMTRPPPTPVWYPNYAAPYSAAGRDRERELETEARSAQASLAEALRTVDRIRYESDLRIRDLESNYGSRIRDVETNYQAQLQTATAAFDKQIDALQQELRDLRRAAERPPVDLDAKLETMFDRLVRPLLGSKEDDRVRRLEEELSREREQRSQQDRDRALREEIAKMETRMERVLEQLTEAQRNRGPDPLLELLRSSTNAQLEAMRQVTQVMMGPRELAGMLKDANTGTDQLMRNVTNTFGSMFDLFREGVNSVLQLQGGGENPIPGMIENGVARVSKLVEAHISSQRDQALADARVKQSYLDAQAKVVEAQAAANWVHTPPPPTPAPTQELPTPSNPPPPPAAPSATAESADPGEPKRAGGLTDAQWFGPAMERVLELRQAVAMYVDATQRRPYKRNDAGDVLGAAPVQSAAFVIQAAGTITVNKIDVPAFRLFLQERYAELVDLLLPDAPQTYRDHVVQYLTKSMTPEVENDEDEDEDEMDGEEEEEEEDDEEDPKRRTRSSLAPTAPRVPAPPRPGVSRTRP